MNNREGGHRRYLSLALIAVLLALFSPFLKDPERDGKQVSLSKLVLPYPSAAEAATGEQEATDDRLSLPMTLFTQLDPDVRLRLIRDEYERRLELKANGLSAQMTDGPRWTSLGPTNGAGKITAVAFHPTSPDIIYVGSHGGGVWKSTDAGTSWVPLTDFIPLMRVGSLAIAASSPETIYVGSLQIGVLKSTDGGATWILPSTVIGGGVVYALSVHPNNPDEALAGTIQGAYKTTDGGASWRQVIGEPTFVYDIERDPVSAQIIYATTGGLGSSRILKSLDGGDTWSDKSSGVSIAESGFNPRIALAISQSNPLVLYATASETTSGNSKSHVYKTTDGGESWSDLPSVFNSPVAGINNFHSAFGSNQGNGNNAIAISPADSDTVVAGGIVYIKTTDGGAGWEQPSFNGGGMHVDALDIQYQGSTLWIGNDGGLWSSRNHGKSTVDHNNTLVTREYYSIAVNELNSNRTLAGSQDNGSDIRPDSGGTEWNLVPGGDGFDCAIDPQDASVAYITVQLGSIFRTTSAGDSNPALSLKSPLFPAGESSSFATVLRIDTKNPSTLYTGTYRVWKTTDRGDSWRPLPTTTTDGSVWRTDELIRDIAIAQSNSEVIVVNLGGHLFRSTNGGASWISLPLGVAPLRLEIDPAIADVMYAAAYAFSPEDVQAAVYVTTDGGRNWTLRDQGLPKLFANVVRVDPVDANVLYCGTASGVYRSTNQGASWLRFGSGLPNVDVRDIQLFNDGSVLRISTFGRGVWEIRPHPHPPEITSASVGGKKLFIRGKNFDIGAKILLNGEPQKTRNDDDNPTTALLGPKAGKRLVSGDRLSVQNLDGSISDEFIFAPAN